MNVLVAYASRYGSTEGIATRVAERLAAAGHTVELRRVEEVETLGGFDAFVLGSAVYFGKWMKPAAAFVSRFDVVLASRPTWLFSSGPLGMDPVDPDGHDLRTTTVPEEIARYEDTLHFRAHRVFFGALDPARLSLGHRVIRALPTTRALLPAGDFRDWTDIESWADDIARSLSDGPRDEAPGSRP